MIEFNVFSGKAYTTIGNVKTDQDGKVFSKCGNAWISTEGNLIQKTAGGYFNTNTGTLSTFGDPFAEVK
jgi:flagellar basal body rod protein FlgG